MPTPKPLLHGELVRLIPLSPEDITLLAKWFSTDMEMLRFSTNHHIYPLSTPEDWERRINDPSRYQFGIRLLEPDSFIGTCSISGFNWQARSAIVGISTGTPALRGKGYGTDAFRLLLRFGFMELNLNRIALYTYSENPRALRAYEKVGFVQEGIIRDDILRDGVFGHTVVMSVLREEWITHAHTG